MGAAEALNALCVFLSQSPEITGGSAAGRGNNGFFYQTIYKNNCDIKNPQPQLSTWQRGARVGVGVILLNAYP
jgi:hypothetical protein